MAVFVFRDGSRLTAWMLYVINLLDADMFRLFGVHVLVTSGIRTYAEQEKIFRARYVTAANINGRRVYDTRVWKGVRWYRISAAGTVAVPGTSNHEIQGTKAAVDLRDTGRDAGISTAGSARSNWLRANASKYGLIASGFSFGEAWHYDVPNIYKTPPSSGGGGSTPTPVPAQPTTEEDDDMAGNSGFYYTEGSGAKATTVYLIVNNDQSTYHEYSNGAGNGPMPSAYNNAMAAAYRTGSFAPITPGHARVIKAQNSAKPGQERVILDWDDVEFAKFLAAIATDNAAPSAAEVANAKK